MNIISSLLRRRSVIEYRTRLKKNLAKDYGGSATYSLAQVQSTLSRHRHGGKHLIYALSMYCTPEVFESYCKENGLDDTFDGTQGIVDEILFKTKLGYSHTDLSTPGYGGESGDGGGGD